MVRNAAPTIPPNNDDEKAADNARAACPFFAKGNPSSTVAWEEDDPGIPINTDAKVSEVGTTATKPIIKANPYTGSRPNMKGSINDNPAIPPKPGNIPMDIPITTPKARYPNVVGCSINTQASDNALRARPRSSTDQKSLNAVTAAIGSSSGRYLSLFTLALRQSGLSDSL